MELLRRIVGEKAGENGLGHLAVIHGGHGHDGLPGKAGELHGDEEPALLGETLQDRPGRGDPEGAVPCTAKFQCKKRLR